VLKGYSANPTKKVGGVPLLHHFTPVRTVNNSEMLPIENNIDIDTIGHRRGPAQQTRIIQKCGCNDLIRGFAKLLFRRLLFFVFPRKKRMGLVANALPLC
jgi:hypothetical protein